jgi:S-DNA-T family DNA segregation ATPase FtsK/SpoIIIE
MSKSIRPYLEYQADRVEAVLNAHQAGGRITGGTVGPRIIRFFLNPEPHTRFAKIRRLADDLALALRVPDLTIDRDTHGVVLSFANPNPSPVDLLPLLEQSRPVPPATALLGLTDEGQPLLVRLSSPEVAHLLVAGTTGSGKSVLLRIMATSLVLTQSPRVLRILCLDPKGRTFQALADAPHLTRPVITQPSEAREALDSLLRTMELRDRRGELPTDDVTRLHGTGVPRILVFIDELADLIMAEGDAITDAITRLVQRGREAGIHLIAATQHPSAAILSSLMRANFPLRLVGRVASASDARVATGRGGTDAHRLQGRGDFLAITGEHPIRFQVANIRESAIREQIRALIQPRALPAPSGPGS